MSTDAASSLPTFPSVAVVGAGVMGGVVIAGLRTAGWPGSSITAAVRRAEHGEELAAEHGITATTSATEAVTGASIVVLGVKPQQMGAVLEEIAGAISPDALVLTVAAALPASFYEERLAPGTAVVRAMPNTPARIGVGATSISAGAHASEEHLALAERILSTTGLVVRVEESLIDAVIAVAGSAPAYYFAMVEAVIEAGVMQGLDRDLAAALAQQTFTGAGALLAHTGDTPATLRQRVSSRGGATLAALEAMSNAGLQGVVSAGANAAVARSKELGEQLAG